MRDSFYGRCRTAGHRYHNNTEDDSPRRPGSRRPERGQGQHGTSASPDRLLSQWENVRLVALTIDEGISGYREETIHSAESLTARLGIEHHCISFY